MKQTTLQRILLAFIWCCMVGGLVFIATLHKTMPYIMMWHGEIVPPAPAGAAYFLTLGCGYAASLGGIALLYILRRMVRSLYEDPFVQRNVRYFRLMGIIALGMALLCIAGAALNSMRPMMLVLGMVLVFCALLSLVMSGVFAEAVRYKNENDLVI